MPPRIFITQARRSAGHSGSTEKGRLSGLCSPRFDETTDLIVTPERGKAVARTMGDRSALFLVSHGIVTVGATIEDAAVNALLLDKAARAQLMVPDATPRTWSSDEDALAKRARVHNPAGIADRWVYLLRKLADWKRR